MPASNSFDNANALAMSSDTIQHLSPDLLGSVVNECSVLGNLPLNAFESDEVRF